MVFSNGKLNVNFVRNDLDNTKNTKTQMWEIEKEEGKKRYENVSIFWHIVIRYYTAISIVINAINVHNNIKYSTKNQAIHRWNWLINQYMVRLIGLLPRYLACVRSIFLLLFLIDRSSSIESSNLVESSILNGIKQFYNEFFHHFYVVLIFYDLKHPKNHSFLNIEYWFINLATTVCVCVQRRDFYETRVQHKFWINIFYWRIHR